MILIKTSIKWHLSLPAGSYFQFNCSWREGGKFIAKHRIGETTQVGPKYSVMCVLCVADFSTFRKPSIIAKVYENHAFLYIAMHYIEGLPNISFYSSFILSLHPERKTTKEGIEISF